MTKCTRPNGRDAPPRLDVLGALADVVDCAAVNAPDELEAYRRRLLALVRRGVTLTAAQATIVDSELGRFGRAA